MATLQEVLSPSVVNRVISRIKVPQSRLQNFFGFQLGGPNNNPIGRRNFSWDIFDKTRSLAPMRAPGTGPATAARQVVGRVTGVFPRFHAEIRLDYEVLHNLRSLGRPAGEIDQMGLNYITRQEEYLAQLFANVREFMVSRMLKGSFDILQDGDNWLPVDVGSGTVTVDYKVPAGNKNQLNMTSNGNIIDARWDNVNTSIFQHILSVNQAFEQQTGRPLRHIWTDSTVWRYVLTNTQIHDVGGTANTVFAQYDNVEERGPDGLPTNEFVGVLRAIPWLKWHIYDAGINVPGTGATQTFKRFFDSSVGEVSFLPDPGPDWTEMVIGSEPVIDAYGSPAVERFGFYAWTFTNIKPASIELLAVDNCIPAIYSPQSLALGNVIF
jgi:hypothetical protein